MTVLLTNNVSTTLSAAIAAGDATFNVVDGNRFPSPTTRAKRAGTKAGKQFVAQPKRIAKKTARFR